MSTTYSALQTRVQRRIIDLPSAVLAEVPQLVNIAINKLQEKHNFRVMETEMSGVTNVNTHKLLASFGGTAITLPGTTNFKEWRGEPWYIRYTDGSPGFMSWAPSREALWGAFTEGGVQASDRGFPSVLLEEPGDDNNNRLVSVYPVADGNSDYSDGEYRITMPYYRYLAPLSAAGDHNWLTDQPSGEEFIVNWAAGEGHALNWDFEKYQILTAKSEVHFKDLVNADKRFRLSAVREWVPHWRGVHSTKTRV